MSKKENLIKSTQTSMKEHKGFLNPQKNSTILNFDSA